MFAWPVVDEQESQVFSAMFPPGHPELERRIQLAEIERTREEGGRRSLPRERRQTTPASLRRAGLDQVTMRRVPEALGVVPPSSRASSSGTVAWARASSAEIRPVRTRSASDWLRVCMPNFPPDWSIA